MKPLRQRNATSFSAPTPGQEALASWALDLEVLGTRETPVVSIVVLFFAGLTSFVLRIRKGNPKRNYNGDYRHISVGLGGVRVSRFIGLVLGFRGVGVPHLGVLGLVLILSTTLRNTNLVTAPSQEWPWPSYSVQTQHKYCHRQRPEHRPPAERSS